MSCKSERRACAGGRRVARDAHMLKNIVFSKFKTLVSAVASKLCLNVFSSNSRLVSKRENKMLFSIK